MTQSKRRTYSVNRFLTESRGIARDIKTAVATLAGLSHAFRERIMLAVTGVNDCRYCKAVHTRAGAASGLSQTEIDRILAGDFAETPKDERSALEFARRWAERDAEDDPVEKAKLVESYGEPTAEKIQMLCRLIRLANLTGNTLDSVLFKLSKGKIGD